jgi:aspartate kinase
MQLQWIPAQQVQSKESFLLLAAACKYNKGGTTSASNSTTTNNTSGAAEQLSGTCFLVETPALMASALSEVSSAFFDGNKDIALQLFEAVKKNVFALVDDILVAQKTACISRLGDLFTEIEWLLHDKPVRSFLYYKDQIVCTGAVLGSALLHHFLLEEGIDNEFLDVRDCIVASDEFGGASVIEDISLKRLQQTINVGSTIVTQAGIGATDQNENAMLTEAGTIWLQRTLTGL